MTNNKLDYAYLSILASGYIVSIFIYKTNPRYIVFATIAFGISYLVWGAYHQMRVRKINLRIMLEYLLVAVLGVVIVSTLLI